MVIEVCETVHKDLCERCDKPTDKKCSVHLKCVCSTKMTAKELIVGYRFKSSLTNGVYAHPFVGATEGTVLTNELPISGPVWKYKEGGEWVIKCTGCNESKSTKISHDWLVQWAFKHRCKKRVDVPR